MHCVQQTSAQDDDVHNHFYVHDHALHDSEDDGDAQYGMCILGDGDDMRSSDPSTDDVLCSDKDATNLASSPNNMVSAMLPMKVPKTNHISQDDRYTPVR